MDFFELFLIALQILTAGILTGAGVMVPVFYVTMFVYDYNEFRMWADLNRKKSLMGAWANLAYSFTSEWRYTKQSLRAKAYASSRLIRLLGNTLFPRPVASNLLKVPH